MPGERGGQPEVVELIADRGLEADSLLRRRGSGGGPVGCGVLVPQIKVLPLQVVELAGGRGDGDGIGADPVSAQGGYVRQCHNDAQSRRLYCGCGFTAWFAQWDLSSATGAKDRPRPVKWCNGKPASHVAKAAHARRDDSADISLTNALPPNGIRRDPAVPGHA